MRRLANSRLFPTILAAALASLSSAAAAAPFGFDFASDPAYAAGNWQTGDNGGAGFEPWVMNILSDQGTVSTAVSDDATLWLGSPLMNVVGRAFVLHMEDFTTDPGIAPHALFSRDLAGSTSLGDGATIRFRVQQAKVGSFTGPGFVRFENSSGQLLLSISGQAVLTWGVVASTTMNTGIPASSPVEFTLVFDETNTDVTVSAVRLDGPETFGPVTLGYLGAVTGGPSRMVGGIDGPGTVGSRWAMILNDFGTNSEDAPPTLDSLVVVDELNIDATFSEQMGAGALDPANYALSGSGRGTLAANPDSVAADPSRLGPPQTYRLTWLAGDQVFGGDLTVTATNLEDDVGNAINENGIDNVATGIGIAVPVEASAFALE